MSKTCSAAYRMASVACGTTVVKCFLLTCVKEYLCYMFYKIIVSVRFYAALINMICLHNEGLMQVHFLSNIIASHASYMIYCY